MIVSLSIRSARYLIGLDSVMMRIVGVFLSVMVLAACSNQAADIQSDFATLNHEEAIIQAHQWYRNDQGIVVHVFADHIRAAFEDGSESLVRIPEDQFYLSIAPWVNYTHPCTYHVPTGCTGELIGKEMSVTAVDTLSGEVVVGKKVVTQHDGFIDFWVPSGRSLEFTITYQDENVGQLTSTEILSTHSDGRTCITTMQLTPQVTSQQVTPQEV